MAAVLKTVGRKSRGFESSLFRQSSHRLTVRSLGFQSGDRGFDSPWEHQERRRNKMNITLTLDDDCRKIMKLQEKFNKTNDTTLAYAYLSSILQIARKLAESEHLNRELETYRQDMIYRLEKK